MNSLARKYVDDIEGFIPDLCGGNEDDLQFCRDSVYDFACDRITDEEKGNSELEQIRTAATQISEHFFGTE